MNKFQRLVKFWCLHPALFYGVSLLLGFYASFYGPINILIPCLGLWLPFLICVIQNEQHFWKPFLLSITLVAAAWCYASAYYIFPSLPKQGVKGMAHLSIQSIRMQHTHFGDRWTYNCELQSFIPNEAPHLSIARHIKCSLAFPNNEYIVRPPADVDYIVQGTLIKTDQGYYSLKISPDIPWSQVQASWSLTEKRYEWKKGLLGWINAEFSNPLNAVFLGGLAIGEFDDQWLRQEFSRFGVQHIMAISGFHFAIIFGVLSLVIRLLFSSKISAWILLLGMAGYTFFLGSNPSIMRAWVMSSIVISGYLLEKNAISLNSLGIALIVTLIINPLFIQSMGFQFSFLSTAAILLVFRPADYYLCHILPKRPLSQVVEMNGWNQHGFCILSFFRQGLALLIAVNLFAIPLTLFHFQQFPWMSLFYNLFFPLLITGSLGLLIVGMITAWIPFAGTWINHINNIYTKLVLQFTYRMPQSLDSYFIIEDFPKEWLVGYLTLTILSVILLRESRDNIEQDEEFVFV